MRLLTLCSVLAVSSLASACIVVPRTEANYDPDCNVTTHRMVLDTKQVGGVNDCSYRKDCVAIVLGLGVTAASAIVSGSIAVVGNVVYWAEERVGCTPNAPTPSNGTLAAPEERQRSS
jgi:hypothetical protein